MRESLLLAASVAALMALPAVAQEQATDQTQATEGEQATTGAATNEVQVVTTTGDQATDSEAMASGDPMQNLAVAAQRLRDVAQQSQGVFIGTDGTATGLTTTTDPAATATDEAMAEDMQQMRQQVTQALDDFDAALQQVSAEGNDQVQAQIEALQQQSQLARQQLDQEDVNAGQSLDSLANAALQLRVATIPAEATGIVGRTVVSLDGQEAGEIENLLITAEGRVEGLVISRGGALGLGGQTIAIPWDQVQMQGDQVMINMMLDQIRDLPDYQAP